jgi:hypothetical protein
MDGLNASQRVWLPDEAETGGYKGIWKKSLHLFHFLAHSDLGDQYDFVFKGDDDTMVNLQGAMLVCTMQYARGMHTCMMADTMTCLSSVRLLIISNLFVATHHGRPQLRTILKAFDPNVPVHLGNNM